MKFLLFIPLSNFQLTYWVYPCGVLNILAPSLLLYFLYSILHNRWPKSVFPNIFYQVLEIPPATYVRCGLLISSPSHLYSMTEDIRHAYVHDPCLLHLSLFERSLNYKFESINHDIFAGHSLSIHDNDTWLPIQYVHSSCLQYVSSFDNLPYCKTNNFIETKSSRNKLRGFNHF